MELHKIVRNMLDFPLRQFFRWKRKGLNLPDEDKSGLFSGLPADRQVEAAALENRFLAQYPLDFLVAHSSRRKYAENLYYLQLMEDALMNLNIELPDTFTAADIGVADWFYVQALYAGLSCFGGRVRCVILEGFEIDAYRVYTDFYSRFDYAQAYIAGNEAVSFIPTAFSRQPEKYDVITQFFPFLLSSDHLDWGLPKKYFEPSLLLSVVVDSLKSGGNLIIVNQGIEENLIQLEMLARANCSVFKSYRFDSVFFDYGLDRYVTLVRKP